MILTPNKLYLVLFFIVILLYVAFYSYKAFKSGNEHFTDSDVVVSNSKTREANEKNEAHETTNNNEAHETTNNDEANETTNNDEANEEIIKSKENDVIGEGYANSFNSRNNEKDEQNKLESCEEYNLRQEIINIFDLFFGRKPSIDEINKYSKAGNIQDILSVIANDFNIPTTDVIDKKKTLDVRRVDSCKHDNNIGELDNTHVRVPIKSYNAFIKSLDEFKESIVFEKIK